MIFSKNPGMSWVDSPSSVEYIDIAVKLQLTSFINSRYFTVLGFGCTLKSALFLAVHGYNGVHDIMAVGPWKGIVYETE